MANGDVDLLKEYCCCKNSTACAIGFMKIVGADSYVRPNALRSGGFR